MAGSVDTGRFHTGDVSLSFADYNRTSKSVPVVLSHCLAGSARLWDELVEPLSQDRPVVVWDAIGHGLSDVPKRADSYSVQRSTSDLAALLDHLSIDRAHVGGLSMGGGISCCFGILFPQRTASLMILDSNTAAAIPRSPESLAAVTSLIDACLAFPDTPTGRKAAAELFVSDNPSYQVFVDGAMQTPPHAHPLRQLVESTSPIGLGHTLRSLVHSDLPVEKVADIEHPTLVLAGEHDPALAAVRLTHERIVGSDLVIVPDAGHMSVLDNPADVAGALLEFLERVDQASSDNG